jgi:DNA-binding response OmpR family regulator/HD-like signal output (HDOD) protein
MKILLVEDEESVGQLILKVLETWGQEVVWCQDGEEAWAALDRDRFELIISDWMLPSMDGTELVRRIRKREDMRQVPVLMMSGRTEKNDIVNAIQTGIDGYLSKPFGPTQLRDKIKEVIKKSRSREPVEERVKEILQGHYEFDAYDESPLVLLGEETNSEAGLLEPRQAERVRYLHRTVRAIQALNAEFPKLRLGYRLETNTKAIVEHIQRRVGGKRVKLVLLAPECAGNSLLMARLLNINHGADLAVFIVCENLETLPKALCAALEHMGQPPLCRRELDGAVLESLMRQQVVERHLGRNPRQRVDPDEIRRNLMEDLERLKALPPLPHVYERIQALDANPSSDLKDWVEIIRLDPLSSSVLLRHARSSAYGFTGDINDVERAIVLLGKKTVAGLVASDAMKRAFGTVEESGFLLRDFWRHSIAAGQAARIMALPLVEKDWSPAQQHQYENLGLSGDEFESLRQIDLPSRLRLDPVHENPFIGGMVHDLGKVVMAQSYPGLFPLLIEHMRQADWSMPMAVAEAELVGGLTHATVGDILGQKWGLGESICRAILLHHQPGEDDTYAFLVGIADFVAHLDFPFPRQASFPLRRLLEDEDREGLEAFLPKGFFDQPLLDLAELKTLVRLVAPPVRRLTEEVAYSVE